MRYAILLAYDGTGFRGWQTQNNGRTVQAAVEKAVYLAFGVRAGVVASGRTDSGVHAAGQVCHFDADISVPGERVADALNTRLPPDVSVLRSAVAPDGFDANASAKRKTYVYRMYFSDRRNPLLDRYALFVRGRADTGSLSEAAALFVGEHDFRAYCASRSSAKTTVRTVYSSRVSSSGSAGAEIVSFEVCGGGFLYNMVRTMAGTVLCHMQGSMPLESIEEGIRTGERALVGRTLPARGLTLESVDYGFDLF